MLYASLKLIHLLSIIVWLGGMVFAHFFLRPAVQQLPPAQRLPLMTDVLGRFFMAVGLAVALVLTSGMWMLGQVSSSVAATGGRFAMPVSWIIMSVLGLLMMAIFGFIRLVRFTQLQQAVAACDWPAGALALASIRRWVGINLALGVVIVTVLQLY